VQYTLLIVVLLLWSLSTQAQAQQRCWPRTHVANYLLEKHGEVVLVRALTKGSNIRVFELFANPTKRTWTVLLTDKSGSACLQGSGTDLDMITAAPPPNGDSS
jgi:membrane peptidoglycan carboxypeptidase